MNSEKTLQKISYNEDPAGYVSESELHMLSDVEDVAGGTTWACALVTAAVGVSVSLCPTTKCTSQCLR